MPGEPRNPVSIPNIPEISAEFAAKILDADRLNIVKKAASGKPLNGRERAIMQSVMAGEPEATGVSIARNKVEATKMLKTSRPTLDKYIRLITDKTGQSPVRANGTVDLIVLRKWLRAEGEPEESGGEIVEELNRTRAQLLLLKLEQEGLKLRELKGELLDMAQMRKATAEAFGALRYLMLSRWDTLAVSLAGQSVVECKRRGKASDADILMQFSGGDWPHEVKEHVRKFNLWLEMQDVK